MLDVRAALAGAGRGGCRDTEATCARGSVVAANIVSTGERPVDRSAMPTPVAQRRTAATLTTSDAAWLAGVLDCDGHVTILARPQRAGRATSYLASVRVGQVRPELVRRCADLTGVGHVVLEGRGVWCWQAAAQQAAGVLRQVAPALVLKRRQAEAAVALADRVAAFAARGLRRVDADELAAREALYRKVRALNAPYVREVPCPRM